MARAERFEGMWSGIAKFARERRDYIAAVLARVAAEGPLAASEFDEGGPRRGTWWDRHDGKYALEYLFWAGKVTTTRRSNSFERSYDLPERVLPRQVLAVPTPSEAEAQRGLMRIAARALGVGTVKDLRDYFRMSPGDGQRAVDALVEEGELVPVSVAGWRNPAYLDAEARIPRRVEARALLVPFDPLIWERARTERLFDFRYRIEIYTPAAQRVHGYYVLPFLLGDALVARVDLKADRANAALRVLAAHGEPKIDRGAVADALTGELRLLASWLGLERVSIGRRGDLAPALRAAARTTKAIAAQ
jgi:hypothetical protein